MDLIIIGSGPGGYRAAVLAALQGLEVTLVEADVWGGCCLNRGCVPKKDWHHSARLLAQSERLAQRGLLGRLQPDLERAWTHQRRVVGRVRESYLDYLTRLGVRREHGWGRLDGPGRVIIDGDTGQRRIEARHIVIASGSHPRLPPGVTLQPDRILTTDELFQRPLPPGRRVALVGGGVIASELAFILRQFGLELEWISGTTPPWQRLPFSAAARRTLQETLQASGTPEPRRARLRSAEADDTTVRIQLDDGHTLEVDWLLLATGRVPHSRGLGLETVGIHPEGDGRLPVDRHLRLAPGLHAIGDCIGGAMTANQALADAATVIHNIRHPEHPLQRRQHDVPLAIYSAVELARVGLNEEEAEDAGHEPAVGFSAFASDPKALGEDAAEGFVRLVADMDRGTLLGAEAVGHGAGELIHQISGLPDPDQALRHLAHSAYNHPSRSEQWQNAAETLAAKWGLKHWLWEDR